MLELISVFLLLSGAALVTRMLANGGRMSDLMTYFAFAMLLATAGPLLLVLLWKIWLG